METRTAAAGSEQRHPLLARVAALGPRLAGRPAERAAADVVLAAFRGLGLEAWLQPFTIVGWEQTEAAAVRIQAPVAVDFAVGAMSFTASTPAGGASGRLVRIGTSYMMPGVVEWPKYAIVDGAGRETAFILGQSDGPAYPIPDSYPHPLLMSPTVNIGQEDARRLDGWLAAGDEVRATVTTAGRHLPGLTSHNVLARLPGATAAEIVVSAHLDTAPGSPGAIDNASGIQGVYDVAARLVAAGTPRHTFTFAAFGTEEYGMLGAYTYVVDRRTRGTLGPVRANLNLDALGAGDTLLCYVAPPSFRATVEAAMAGTGTGDRFSAITYAETRRVVDAYPFHAEGIANVSLITWPYAAYHQPGDDLDLVDHERVALLSRFAQGLALSLDAEGVATGAAG